MEVRLRMTISSFQNSVFCLATALILLSACSQKTELGSYPSLNPSRGLAVTGSADGDSDRPWSTSAASPDLQASALQVLSVNCAGCHNAPARSGGIDFILDPAKLVSSGLIVPGSSGASRLYRQVQSGAMPMGRTMDAASKKILADWIDQGAGAPPAPTPPVATPTPPIATPTPPIATPTPPIATPTPSFPTPTPPVATPPPAATPTPAPDSGLEASAYQVLLVNCASCHNTPSRAGGIDFILDSSRLVTSGLVVPGRSGSSPLYQQVQAGAMPLGGNLDPANQKILADWIDQGARAFPGPEAPPAPSKPLHLGMALEEIQRDLQAVSSGDRKFMRYLTLTHIQRSAKTAQEKALFVQAVAKAVNSVTWREQLTSPVVVDADQTVVRIDIRRYDISPSEWNFLVENYPFARQLSRDGRWSQLKSSTQATVPVVRGDWFVRRVTQPDAYKRLLELPNNVSELERRLRVNANDNISRRRVIRAGFDKSGVSFSNRVIERHQARYGAYWKSYDFASESGRQNIFRNPFGPVLGGRRGDKIFEHNGGEMIFALPNGLHGYYLTNAAGGYLDEGPRDIVEDPSRRDRTVTNGTSCFTCHTSGIIPVADEIRASAERQRRAFSRDDLSRIRSLYGDDESLGEVFAKDMAAYRAALGKLKITGGGEPVSAATLYYDRDLDLKTVAEELDLTSEELDAKMKANADLRRLLSPRRGSGGKVTRRDFESRFGAVLNEL